MHDDTPLPPIRDRAIAYLAKRDHTRHELAGKLARAGYEADEIDALLAELSGRGWLSDQRFAENFVNLKQARYGSLRLAHELRQRGVAEEEIQRLLGRVGDTELDRAREVWRKKFGAPPANASERARQIRFLQSRGFSYEVSRRVLSATQE